MYYWLFNDSIPLQYDVGVIQVCIVYFLSSTLLFMMTFANHGLESDFVLKLIILGETDAGKHAWLQDFYIILSWNIQRTYVFINTILVIVIFRVYR